MAVAITAPRAAGGLRVASALGAAPGAGLAGHASDCAPGRRGGRWWLTEPPQPLSLRAGGAGQQRPGPGSRQGMQLLSRFNGAARVGAFRGAGWLHVLVILAAGAAVRGPLLALAPFFTTDGRCCYYRYAVHQLLAGHPFDSGLHYPPGYAVFLAGVLRGGGSGHRSRDSGSAWAGAGQWCAGLLAGAAPVWAAGRPGGRAADRARRGVGAIRARGHDRDPLYPITALCSGCGPIALARVHLA